MGTGQPTPAVRQLEGSVWKGQRKGQGEGFLEVRAVNKLQGDGKDTDTVEGQGSGEGQGRGRPYGMGMGNDGPAARRKGADANAHRKAYCRSGSYRYVDGTRAGASIDACSIYFRPRRFEDPLAPGPACTGDVGSSTADARS